MGILTGVITAGTQYNTHYHHSIYIKLRAPQTLFDENWTVANKAGTQRLKGYI